ncbi:hypothetical protein FSP39_002849 [Pinctada imbricata]|uniref:Uncharacterized protein n=1 Tax=Pinctada imbricata TaxID=66713 RepID=A0AA88Y2E0_PINIB|nr:hypothetical protein FSP39_002849 [Pinctada imbricata]
MFKAKERRKDFHRKQCETVDVIVTDEEANVVRYLSHGSPPGQKVEGDGTTISIENWRCQSEKGNFTCIDNASRDIQKEANTFIYERVIRGVGSRTGPVADDRRNQQQSPLSEDDWTKEIIRSQKVKKVKKKKGFKNNGSALLKKSDSKMKGSRSAENLCMASGLAAAIGTLHGARSMIELRRRSASPTPMADDNDEICADDVLKSNIEECHSGYLSKEIKRFKNVIVTYLVNPEIKTILE